MAADLISTEISSRTRKCRNKLQRIFLFLFLVASFKVGDAFDPTPCAFEEDETEEEEEEESGRACLRWTFFIGYLVQGILSGRDNVK